MYLFNDYQNSFGKARKSKKSLTKSKKNCIKRRKRNRKFSESRTLKKKDECKKQTTLLPATTHTQLGQKLAKSNFPNDIYMTNMSLCPTQHNTTQHLKGFC